MIQFAIGFFVGVAVAIIGMAVIALWFDSELISTVDEED